MSSVVDGRESPRRADTGRSRPDLPALSVEVDSERDLCGEDSGDEPANFDLEDWNDKSLFLLRAEGRVKSHAPAETLQHGRLPGPARPVR